jgi:hypothetical protein
MTQSEGAGEPTRRDFLYIATGMAGVVGVGSFAWPFIDQMNPDASTLALASIEVNVEALEPGMSLTVKCAQRQRCRRFGSNRPRSFGGRGQGKLDRDDRFVHPSGLRAARPGRRLRRLVLPVSRFALRHGWPHPQGSGPDEPSGSAVRLCV